MGCPLSFLLQLWAVGEAAGGRPGALLVNLYADPHSFLHKSTRFTGRASLSLCWPLALSQYRKSVVMVSGWQSSCFSGVQETLEWSLMQGSVGGERVERGGNYVSFTSALLSQSPWERYTQNTAQFQGVFSASLPLRPSGVKVFLCDRR